MLKLAWMFYPIWRHVHTDERAAARTWKRT
jgi:hypothetical protein